LSGKYHFLPWWSRQQVLENCSSSRPHSVKSQKTLIFSVTKNCLGLHKSYLDFQFYD
jgi:hypothetical protein